VQVACGDEHSLALKLDGSIASWGYDGAGQVSNTPTGNDFVQVAGGGYHSLALKSDGSIVSWGSDIYRQLSRTPAGSHFGQVAGGGYHSIALDIDPNLKLGSPDTWFVLTVTNLVAGQTALVNVGNATVGGTVIAAYSLAGGGPINTPWGAGLLTPPWFALPFMTANAAGVASMSVSVPMGTVGMSVWFQSLDWRAQALSNGLAMTVR